MKKVLKKFILDSIELILIVGTVFILTNIFLGQLLLVTGDSMYPALKNDEQIIGEKISLNFTKPQRGEIVIFNHPEKDILIVKRVVGLPEETVKIAEGQIYIDREILKEPYVKDTYTNSGDAINENVEYKIPENSYFLVGDNREKSVDGRKWGFINGKSITSRGFLIYYPLKSLKLLRN